MKTLQYYIIALLLVVLASCGGEEPTTVDAMVEQALEQTIILEPADVLAIMESDEVYTVIDVREKNEYYHGYIPGAVCVPRGSIEFSIGSQEFWDNEGLYMPNKDERIILYCKKGKRSVLAAYTLKSLGYTNVVVVKDGWKNWELTYPDKFEKNLEMLSGGSASHNQGGGC